MVNNNVNEAIKNETKRLQESGGKVIDQYTKDGEYLTTINYSNLTYKTAKKIARKNVKKSLGYIMGQLGVSRFAKLPSRKDRRELARKNKVKFEPVYNN